MIQYREKGLADRELLVRARELRILTAQARVPLIMNDRVDLARLASCDGVHLGQDDLSVRDARRDPRADAADRRLDPRPRTARRRDPRRCRATWASGRSFPARPRSSPSPSWPGLAFVRLAAESTVAALVRDRRDQRGESRPRAGSGCHARRRQRGCRPCRQPPRAARRLKARLEGLDAERTLERRLPE